MSNASIKDRQQQDRQQQIQSFQRRHSQTSFGADVDRRMQDILAHSAPVKPSVADQLEELQVQRSSTLLMEMQGSLHQVLKDIDQQD